MRRIFRPRGAGGRRTLLATALAYALFAVTSVVPASAADVTVTITDTLDPLTLEIGLGDSVTWRNDDGERHRMRSTSGPEEFDSGNLDAGEFKVELYRGGAVPFELTVAATPNNCEGEIDLTVSWDRDANTVDVAMRSDNNTLEVSPSVDRDLGVDYFPNAFFPEPEDVV